MYVDIYTYIFIYRDIDIHTYIYSEERMTVTATLRPYPEYSRANSLTNT